MEVAAVTRVQAVRATAQVSAMMAVATVVEATVGEAAAALKVALTEEPMAARMGGSD